MDSQVALSLIALAGTIVTALFAFLGTARRSTVEGLKRRILELESDRDDRDEDIDRLQRFIDQRSHLIENLRQEVLDLRNELAVERKARKELERQLVEEREARHAQEATIRELQQELKKERADNETLRDRIRKLEDRADTGELKGEPK